MSATEQNCSVFIRIEEELNKVILGQEELIRNFLTGILAGGHILLEGLPGLGKTQMVRAFTMLCGLEYRRIQFTPDLMPLDITGSNILNKNTDFEFHQGPVFTNIVIADEINRASPKTQAALLEAMQEKQVTILGQTRKLPDPFNVLATQNPIELEGTYPLPEAQLDRFLFKLVIEDVPAHILERIITDLDGGKLPELGKVLSHEEFTEAVNEAAKVKISQPVAAYIARLVAATRPDKDASDLRKYLKFGASPRAVISMASAAKARAFLEGRSTVGFEYVKAIALPVLRHRILLEYHAQLEGVDSKQVIDELLKSVNELERSEPDSLARRLAGEEK